MTQEKFGGTEKDGGADGMVTGQVRMSQGCRVGSRESEEGSGWCMQGEARTEERRVGRAGK